MSVEEGFRRFKIVRKAITYRLLHRLFFLKMGLKLKQKSPSRLPGEAFSKTRHVCRILNLQLTLHRLRNSVIPSHWINLHGF
ncbi:MAG: hypothetical protein ACK5SQ_11130, partial [Chitinophagales bacterium]